MKNRAPKLLSAKELHDLIENALASLRDVGEFDIFDTDPNHHHKLFISLSALRFCAAQAVVLKEVSLLPQLAEAIEAIELYNDEATELLTLTLRVMTSLLRLGPALPEKVVALASHPRAKVRAAVSDGLTTNSAQELALLETFANDSAAEVRNPAKEKLSKIREIPWWTGKFSQAPSDLINEETAPSLKTTLEAISALLEHSWFSAEQQAQLISLVTVLPDVLLFDLARVWLSDFEQTRTRRRVLLRVLLQRSGGCVVLQELMIKWINASWGFAMGSLIGDELALVSSQEACLSLLSYVEGAGVVSEWNNPYRSSAEAIARGWPKDADPSPILNAILREDFARGVEFAASELAKLFQRPELNVAPVLERFIEAHLAGYPGTWRRVSSQGKEMLARASLEVLGRVVDASLQSQEKDLVKWGILHRMGRLYDEAQEISLPALVVRLFTEHRALFFSDYDLRLRALPLLRQDLVTKSLNFEEAADVMRGIDALYGGCVDLLRDDYDKTEENQAKRQIELEPFFAQDILRGPATEQEWRHYREVRDATVFEGDPRTKQSMWRDALHVLPTGVLPQEDRVFLYKAWHFSDDGDQSPDIELGLALALAPQEEFKPVWERLNSQEGASCLSDRMKKTIKALLFVQPAQQSSITSWLDEEDEDE